MAVCCPNPPLPFSLAHWSWSPLGQCSHFCVSGSPRCLRLPWSLLAIPEPVEGARWTSTSWSLLLLSNSSEENSRVPQGHCIIPHRRSQPKSRGEEWMCEKLPSYPSKWHSVIYCLNLNFLKSQLEVLIPSFSNSLWRRKPHQKTQSHLYIKFFITGNIGPYTTRYQQYKFNLSKSSFKQQKTKK